MSTKGAFPTVQWESCVRLFDTHAQVKFDVNRSISPSPFSALSATSNAFSSLREACRSRVAAGPTLPWSMQLLEDFTAEVGASTWSGPPLMTEHCSMISWEESIRVVSIAPGSRLLLNASCLCRCWEQHRSLSPGCRGPMVLTRWLIFSNQAVLPAEEAADLLRIVRRLLDLACSLLDFVAGVTSAFSTSRRRRENRDWLWTPAAPIFTSVLLSLSRSPLHAV